MKIFIIFSILIIAILLISRNLFYSAKRNLFKDQSAWSGKDLKIKYKNPSKVSETIASDNYLKIIADESKVYLEDQSENEDDENK